MLEYLFTKNNDFRKYIILSTPRSGSTLLSRMILAHPNVTGRGEYFDRLKGKNPAKLLEKIFKPQRKSIKAVGFNIHYNHPADEKKREAWELLKECQDLHIIHLSRKNILRYYLSSKIACKLNLFRIKTAKDRPSLESRRVSISPPELTNIINDITERYRLYNKIFSKKTIIEIEFEKIILKPEVEFTRITKFLDLPEKKPKILTEIMNPEPMSKLIINYHELKSEFSSSEWAWMFD
jgi:LPS sulfotransferase NodH